MSSAVLELYDKLKARLGEDEARTIVAFVEEKIERQFKEKEEILATKLDLSGLRSDLIKWMFIFWVGQFAAMVTLMKVLG